MPAFAAGTGGAPSFIPDDFQHAALIIKRAAGGTPPEAPLYAKLDVADIGWAAARRYGDGASGMHAVLRDAAWPLRIATYTSRQGTHVAPMRQFFRNPPPAPAHGGLRRAVRLGGPILRFRLEDLARMDPGELPLLLAEVAFAAADYEAAAVISALLGRLPARRGAAAAGNGGGSAPANPRLLCIDCEEYPTRDCIAKGAGMLRDRGYGGSGFVLYEPLARTLPDHERPRLSASQPAGISVWYGTAPVVPRPAYAAGTASGIVRVGSWALNQPLAMGGPTRHTHASIMFDPYAAFALRDGPSLRLEAWLDWDGEDVSVEATHTVCIDVNEDAVCLLRHTRASAQRE